ncbi:GntR family transcriptional regulator [Burkholderia sp. Leaf177]|uniref:GntR family transcriptional regulator n=1 Tax=Burkholderia sp. Leaf177 TaxID=1736287 RepID=UPI0006FEB771|nr:GntR family transcriptional regulator [Burkholderia sp. Leaf177]KQR78480.1 GntR family transcriptional regulator [Burkholderia sp. Leaf177]
MAAKLLKLQARTDYVDEVYKVLLDAISEGSLAPGARITQEEIAEQLAVSRSPVLQALRLLKKDGLVQDAPGRGLLVAPLDATWIAHLYEIRGALDSLAASLAAQRGATLDKTLISKGRRASKGDDVKAMIDADWAFHSAIYRASGNPLIEQTAHLHWVHLRRVMGAVLQSSAQRKSIWDEHAAIFDAIIAGDAAAAVELTNLHTHRARENLVKRLGEVLADDTSNASAQVRV